MTTDRWPDFDPSLIVGWLAARSIGRGISAPTPDRGGWRVDTNSAKEQRRWVFPQMHEGLVELGREISAPRHVLKLCGTDQSLRRALPSKWEIQAAEYLMMGEATRPAGRPLLDGYRLEIDEAGCTVRTRVLATDGSLAASGYATEAAGVFAYDRIETAEAHRRQGLGQTVMTTLATHRRSSAATQILVATSEGRSLYESLGWRVVSPWATAAIPAKD